MSFNGGVNMKVHIMHTGEVWIDNSLAFREKSIHPAPYTGWLRGKKHKVCVPVSCYLIEHSKGLVLVDTGWNEEIRINQKLHLGNLAYSMYKGELPKGTSIKEQLFQKGIHPKDIEYVILSHMHSDHVSGLKHVTEAKNILVSDVELRATQKCLGYIPSMWSGVPIRGFSLETIPYGPYRKGYDLFDDHSLYLVHTPGHTDGMISVLVKGNKQWIVLASDAGYAKKSWENMILPGLTTNKVAAKKSLEWIKQMGRDKDCIQVIANHDPHIIPGIIEVK